MLRTGVWNLRGGSLRHVTTCYHVVPPGTRNLLLRVTHTSQSLCPQRTRESTSGWMEVQRPVVHHWRRLVEIHQRKAQEEHDTLKKFKCLWIKWDRPTLHETFWKLDIRMVDVQEKDTLRTHLRHLETVSSTWTGPRHLLQITCCESLVSGAGIFAPLLATLPFLGAQIIGHLGCFLII